MTSSGVPDKNTPVGETLPATQTSPRSASLAFQIKGNFQISLTSKKSQAAC